MRRGAGLGRSGLSNRERRIAPKGPIASGGAAHPGGHGAAGDAPGPGVLEVLVAGAEAALGGALEEPGDDVEDDVEQDAGDEAVGDAVGEGHGDDGDEGRDGVAEIPPVDVGRRRHHHRAHQDQHAARRPGRDGREYRREEHRDEKAEACCHGG